MDKIDIDPVEVRVAALRKGLHLYQLAARIGVAPSRLSAILHGTYAVDEALLKKLATTLGVEAKALRRAP